jgi:choice-of-anchor C domain-containing protein
LIKAGIELQIHVVGFGIDKPLARKQLNCIAEVTGGRYRDAANAAELKTTLEGAARGSMREPADETNLIKNGSFEIGPDPGSFAPYNAGATSISSWRVTHQIDYIGNYWRASDGKRSVDLDGTPGAGGVAQSFATTPGQEYVVTFDLAGNPDCAPPTKRMRASAAGQAIEFSFPVSGKSTSEMGWERKLWRFKAKATTTTIEFLSLDGPASICGPALDNVSVIAAAAPK